MTPAIAARETAKVWQRVTKAIVPLLFARVGLLKIKATVAQRIAKVWQRVTEATVQVVNAKQSQRVTKVIADRLFFTL